MRGDVADEGMDGASRGEHAGHPPLVLQGLEVWPQALRTPVTPVWFDVDLDD
ncbi:hypothetical protein [Streptomyces gossypiisoli]|uniref:hypothetical protein n=1 Tax=Streptomyces gossypiisoli TaxID=2748864 RepID=UPI0015D9AEF6|nr:hypothetical protein [Streptomyces gossypiisoli]